jgi:hypothetical protein
LSGICPKAKEGKFPEKELRHTWHVTLKNLKQIHRLVSSSSHTTFEHIECTSKNKTTK